MWQFHRPAIHKFAIRVQRTGKHNSILNLVLASAVVFGVVKPLAAQVRYESANFVVTADSAEVARQVAESAEECRSRFAQEWLSDELPFWSQRCLITVEEKSSGGQGWISYQTADGKTDQIEITLTGTLDRIFEYVLPHEIAHAALAVTTDRVLPRWIDEGVALMCESESQQARQRRVVEQLAANGTVESLKSILVLVNYPDEQMQLLRFYASSFSLTEYLVGLGGRRRFVAFVKDGSTGEWEDAMMRHYGRNMEELESDWRQVVLSRSIHDPLDLETAQARTP